MSDLPKQLRIKAGMIRVGERIAWGSDSALMEQAADLIEQQQTQIVECERLHRELATSLRHDAESPSLCDLVAVARAVVNERDDLAVTVERLREASHHVEAAQTQNAFNKAVGVMHSIIEQVPSQNLNVVRRESYREGYSSGWKHSLGTKAEDGNHYACGERLAVQLSDQLYPD